MSNKITFRNKETGQYKEATVGFSWTVFFFGFFVPLIRGDMKNAMILLFLGLFTLGGINIIYAFIYNKIYMQDLISQGYMAVLSEQEAQFMSAKIGMVLPVSKMA